MSSTKNATYTIDINAKGMSALKQLTCSIDKLKAEISAFDAVLQHTRYLKEYTQQLKKLSAAEEAAAKKASAYTQRANREHRSYVERMERLAQVLQRKNLVTKQLNNTDVKTIRNLERITPKRRAEAKAINDSARRVVEYRKKAKEAIETQKQLAAQITRTTKQVDTYASRVKRLTTKLNLPSNVTTARQREPYRREAIRTLFNAENTLQQHRTLGIQSYTEYSSSIRDLTQQYAALQRTTRAAITEASRLGRFRTSLRLTNELSRQTGAYNNQLRRLRLEQRQASRSTVSFNSVMSSFVRLLSIGFAVARPITEFARFERQMETTKSVTAGTQLEFRRLTETAKDLGRTTEFTATQVAEGMEYLGRAGLSASDQLKAIPAVLDLAVISGLSLREAADISTNVLTGLGKSASELGSIVDTLATVSVSSNSTVQELGHALTYAGALGSAVGSNITELVVALGMLHNAGMKSTMAGTAIRGMLSSLLTPTKLQTAALAALGKAVEGSRIEIIKSNGDFVGFIRLIEQLEEAGASTADVLRLFGDRAGTGVAALLKQGSEAMRSEYLAALASTGTAAAIAAKKHDTLIGKVYDLKSALSGVGIAIGGTLSKQLKTFITSLAQFTNNLTDFLETNKAAATSFVTILVAALGAATIAIASWISSGLISSLSRGVTALTMFSQRVIAYIETLTSLLIPATEALAAALSINPLFVSLALALAAATTAYYLFSDTTKETSVNLVQLAKDTEKASSKIDKFATSLESIKKLREELAKLSKNGTIISGEDVQKQYAALRTRLDADNPIQDQITAALNAHDYTIETLRVVVKAVELDTRDQIKQQLKQQALDFQAIYDENSKRLLKKAQADADKLRKIWKYLKFDQTQGFTPREDLNLPNLNIKDPNSKNLIVGAYADQLGLVNDAQKNFVKALAKSNQEIEKVAAAALETTKKALQAGISQEELISFGGYFKALEDALPLIQDVVDAENNLAKVTADYSLLNQNATEILKGMTSELKLAKSAFNDYSSAVDRSAEKDIEVAVEKSATAFSKLRKNLEESSTSAESTFEKIKETLTTSSKELGNTFVQIYNSKFEALKTAYARFQKLANADSKLKIVDKAAVQKLQAAADAIVLPQQRALKHITESTTTEMAKMLTLVTETLKQQTDAQTEHRSTALLMEASANAEYTGLKTQLAATLSEIDDKMLASEISRLEKIKSATEAHLKDLEDLYKIAAKNIRTLEDEIRSFDSSATSFLTKINNALTHATKQNETALQKYRKALAEAKKELESGNVEASQKTMSTALHSLISDTDFSTLSNAQAQVESLSKKLAEAKEKQVAYEKEIATAAERTARSYTSQLATLRQKFKEQDMTLNAEIRSLKIQYDLESDAREKIKLQDQLKAKEEALGLLKQRQALEQQRLSAESTAAENKQLEDKKQRIKQQQLSISKLQEELKIQKEIVEKQKQTLRETSEAVLGSKKTFDEVGKSQLEVAKNTATLISDEIKKWNVASDALSANVKAMTSYATELKYLDLSSTTNTIVESSEKLKDLREQVKLLAEQMREIKSKIVIDDSQLDVFMRKFQLSASEIKQVFSMPGVVPRATGGPVYDPSSSGLLPGTDTGKDSVYVHARAGEWFIRNEATNYWRRNFGDDLFNGINSPASAAGQRLATLLQSGMLKAGFATGGIVESMSNAASASRGSLSVNPKPTVDGLVRVLMETPSGVITDKLLTTRDNLAGLIDDANRFSRNSGIAARKRR